MPGGGSIPAGSADRSAPGGDAVGSIGSDSVGSSVLALRAGGALLARFADSARVRELVTGLPPLGGALVIAARAGGGAASSTGGSLDATGIGRGAAGAIRVDVAISIVERPAPGPALPGTTVIVVANVALAFASIA